MKVFEQLKLLVWKNFALRKRQTKRNIIEIAWPLVIFLILVAVRTKRPPYQVNNLYYRPRALPSAGLLPFVQSFFCDYRGQAFNYSDIVHQGNELPDIQNSSIARLLEDAIPLIENSTLRNRLLRLNTDFQKYVRDQQYWTQLVQAYQNGTNITSVILRNVLNDPQGFQQYLINQIGLSPQIAQELLTAKLDQQQVDKLLSLSSAIPKGSSSLLPLLLGLLPATASSRKQQLEWFMKILQPLSQNQRLTAAQIKDFACEPGSPVAIEKIVKLSQGNITEVKSALCSLDNAKLQNLTAELRRQIKMPSNLPNTTTLLKQSKVLQSLMKDAQNLYEDSLALLPIEHVISDYVLIMQNMRGTPDFNNILCSGRWKTKPNTTWSKRPGISNMGGISGAVADFLRPNKQHQSKKYNITRPYAGFDNCTYKLQAYSEYMNLMKNKTAMKLEGRDKCSVIDPKNRIDCGWPGMSPSQCSQIGCCFDSSIKGAHYCFYEPKEAQCGCILGTASQSISGASDKTQRPAYDRGFVQLSQLFLHGEILYTPDNPTTRKIISKIKGEVSDIGLIEQFATWWINNSDTLRSNLENASSIYRTFLNAQPANQSPTNLLAWLQIYNISDFVRLENLFNNSAIQYLMANINGTQNISTVIDNLDGMFKSFRDTFRCFNHEYFRGYPNEDSLIRRALNTSRAPVIASLVFENVNENSIPNHVKYTIRQDVDFTPRTDRIRGWYWRPGPRDGFTKNGYLNFGFLFLQDLIDRALMSMILNETVYEPGVYVQQFPYPCYIRDTFVWYIGGPMPLLMTLAWVYSVAMIIKGIVYEKEKKLKEVMKVMGLGRIIHWVAWFINSSILMLISIIMLVITMKYGLILANSNAFIVFIFLVVFMISTIMMCFLISVFFSRANVAAACGGIIFFMTYLPYSLVRWFEAFMTTSQKAVTCLSSTTAFGLACSYFARYEEQGTGIQWDNLFSSPIEGDGFSLGYTLSMMLVDAVLYGIITWYLEAVMPGQYGIARPWYFPFLKSYWFPKRYQNINQARYQNSTTSRPTPGIGMTDGPMAHGMDEVTFQAEGQEGNKDIAIESEPTHLPLGVSVKNLVKIYKEGGTVAVDGLNLNLYEGQITSFLGHNGAGKTTTMYILTGLYAPTSGTAIISGLDIRKDVDLVRKSLGMCPQHNVLFDQLTVEEHLWFYSSLKGMEKSKIPQEIEKFLSDIGLENKRNEIAANLSGGMKRKLSVGMAFIAGSKVVILDEPTAGVDPYARRGIWDLLLKYKPGRTVLLSTHHMDEADILGDRIAIISHGKLQCCGSSLFLKGHYGNGYYLTLTKRSPEDRPTTAGTLRDIKLRLENVTESSSSDEGVFLDSVDASERDSQGSSASSSDTLPTGNDSDLHCSESTVTSFIKTHIPTAQLVEHVGSELTYVLPTEAAKEGKFQDMFESLDRNLGKLRVGSYGVSDTTLEEVFLKVAEESIDESADKFAAEVPKRRFSFRHHLFSRSRIDSDDVDLLENMEEEKDDELEDTDDVIDGSCDRKSTGLHLLFRQFWALVVKRFHHTRRNKKAFASQIILPAIFVCIAMIVAQIRPFYEMPPILLSTKMFQDSLPHDQYMVFSNNNPNDPLAKNLTDTFLHYPGVGVTCMDHSCPRDPITFKGPMSHPSNSSPDCSCSSGIPECPAGAGGPPPREWNSYSGDILQNMTGRNISGHLLKTYKEFIKRRYGGVTFGDNVRNLPLDFAMSQDPVVKRLISPRNTKAWYNNNGYHAMPTYLNILSNNILRNKAKAKGYDPADFGISVTNHPMNYTKEQLGDQTLIKQAVDVLVAICVVFALSFVPASFVLFLVNERTTKAKHLHMVSGVRPYIYWIANYFWDMCNYFIPAMLCVLIFLCFNDESYTSASNFPPTLCLLLLYGWAITPLMYPASYVFSVPSTAYIVLICANLFIGVNCTIATFILEMFHDDQELADINDWLKVIFLAFPNYCLGRGLIDLAKNQFLSIFNRFGQNLVRDPFSWDITGRNIFAMIIQGFVFFSINVLIQYRFFIKQRPTKNTPHALAEEDDDVKRERQRVVSGTGSSTDAIRIVNLTKVYNVRKKNNLAVNQLCVGVSKGECFGLLGVNGAGKTTTFEMLTGDISVTSGEAYVNGYSILSEIHKARLTMGYCPQFDGLDDLLTAQEHLYLYARLRGVPEVDIKHVVKTLVHKMNLTQYQDVCAGKYSGGNKRKLSTAIALVGNPDIIFMDEPTTGMDPRARRFLWNIITSIVKEGRTVVLTSHSMEECEALCNRVAIMVNGQFKCLGSPQHLKTKYGEGYTIVLKVAGPNPETEQVSEFIKTIFPNAVLKDKHLNMLEYQLPSRGLSVANVFGHLEANRKIFNIEDYSVSQTTLDQVFINFAKEQTDGMDDTETRDQPGNNLELSTMRYAHLIDGTEPDEPINV